MKHISRRFLYEMNEEQYQAYVKRDPTAFIERGKILDSAQKKNLAGREILLKHGDVPMVGYVEKLQGDIFIFPYPDPTLIYFSNAQLHRRLISSSKVDLLKNLKIEGSDADNITHQFYTYYGAVCGCIIFLFISLESFMNSLLKPTDIFVSKTNRRDEVYNYLQIQQYLSHDDKIKNAIPQITTLDFYKDHPTKRQVLENLKEFRDNIIHTKKEDSVQARAGILKKSFKFNYDAAIDAVASYMNFYKENYITECGCGNDF